MLGQEKSRLRAAEQLHRIFYATRFLRRLNRLGYVHFRRWKLYGEEALARHPAVIWLHGDVLTVEYQKTPLAQYTVRYQPDKKHFKAVPEARRFETAHRSLQRWLWELDETLWHRALRLPDYAPAPGSRDDASRQKVSPASADELSRDRSFGEISFCVLRPSEIAPETSS